MGEIRIEGGELELFVESEDEEDMQDEQRPHHPDAPGTQIPSTPCQAIEGREGQLPQQDRIEVQVDGTRAAGDPHHPQAEHRREHQADGCVLLEPPAPQQGVHPPHRQHPRAGRAEQQKRGAEIPDDQESRHDPREDRMADGIADEDHSAQQQEGPRQGAGGPSQGGHQDDLNLRGEHGTSSGADTSGAEAHGAARSGGRAKPARRPPGR